jgi:hypothetical protein
MAEAVCGLVEDSCKIRGFSGAKKPEKGSSTDGLAQNESQT